MEVSPPTDLQYDMSFQEWCFVDSTDASVAALLSEFLLDDPSENLPWEQSFTSLLGDEQRSTITQPPADADLWILSANSWPGRTNTLGVSQSTQEASSDSYFSMRKQRSDDFWSSEEENFLASLGLGSICSGVTSLETCSTTTTSTLSLQEEVVDKRGMQQLLQTDQCDLSNVTIFNTDQPMQQQQQVGAMSGEEKQVKQQQKQQRRRWSDEEHSQFIAGIEKYGWGNWKMVTSLIPGRSVPQVTSHAQHYQRQHQNNTNSKRRRRN